MATSGTTSFNLTIDDVISEAYERIGIQSNSGHDLKSARRSLNILFSEWGNRGVHLWKVELNEVALVAGTPTYSVPSNVSDVLEAYISTTPTAQNNTNTQDVTLTKVDRSAYQAIPNKYQTGQPSQYFVDRQITPTISLYLTPDASTYTTLKYYSINRISVCTVCLPVLHLDGAFGGAVVTEHTPAHPVRRNTGTPPCEMRRLSTLGCYCNSGVNSQV